eukprot:gnl/MRDRNA2_/MRDRNA2_84316_c0_seq1.p1 gnl/MRDRNA2_/MRDRNA2_84316_c0~~gnl/MRDRNA2_/MRDRNA2_84316_c0_seq1.p1  ORF type:complete len:461 (+),score=60.17 gnl/MRDRNA2_/MRDRNA2_84316_c0_seq1:31-1383(+)
MSSDLLQVLEGVPQPLVDYLASIGVDNREVFAALHDHPEQHRQFWKDLLDEGKVKVDGEEAMVVVAKAVAAWKRAQKPGISLQTYTFASVTRANFDQRGVLYALGTNFGKQHYVNPKQSNVVDVQFSGDGANYYSRSTGHLKGDFQKASQIVVSYQHPGDNATQWSLGAPGAWFLIDLKFFKLQVTHYCYRGDYGGGGNHPRTWDLEASNDGSHWITLRSHHRDASVTNECCGSWPVQSSEFFSKFRIHNKGSPNHLCCSGIEFYGSLKAEGGTIFNVTPTQMVHNPVPNLSKCAYSNVVQFRVSDTTCGDHLDDNNYWLQKDGLSFSTLPPQLQAAGLNVSDWQALLNEINTETQTRCTLGTCCFLFWICTPIIGCTYCYAKGGELKGKYLKICQKYESQWSSHGIKVRLTSVGSYMEMPCTGYPTGLTKADTEKDRGVFVFQVICQAS